MVENAQTKQNLHNRKVRFSPCRIEQAGGAAPDESELRVMDGLSRVGAGNRVGGLLRNRSQEWTRQDSSSDNEDDLRSTANAKTAAHNMNLNGISTHQHEYEEPRNVVEARKVSLGECSPTHLI